MNASIERAALETDLKRAEEAYEKAQQMPIEVYYPEGYGVLTGTVNYQASIIAEREAAEAQGYAWLELREAQEQLYWFDYSAAHEAGYEENGPDLNAPFNL